MQKKLNSCELIGAKKNIPEINRRSALAMRCIGQDECETLANASKSEAALEEKILDGTRNCIAVSGDGTWKTRGHTTLVGVCTLIGVECGKVLDIEIMSSFCKVCESFKGPKFGPKYSVFLAKHQPFAKKNHNGFAGQMEEMEIQRHICLSLVEKKPYGDSIEIEKIECVGHVQKRMGSRLRKLKSSIGKKKLSDGKTIGGKGRLTDVVINRLTTFYGNAIRGISKNVHEMRQAIWAVWAHTASTEEQTKHWFCPKGNNSWCKYNVCVQNNKVQGFKHKNNLPEAVSKAIKHIFKDLSHLKLLRRCLGAVWDYNDGHKSQIDIMNAMGWKYNKNNVTTAKDVDKKRLSTAFKRVTAASLESRKNKRLKLAKENVKFKLSEGCAYDPGAY
ncbi:uncharacterized protein TNCV_1878541 [Trichonephila clavipes]|nr:uncharacterized protein TNCV_1878541 [Trichonephila clavipes]